MVYIDSFSQTETSERPRASGVQVPRQALRDVFSGRSSVGRKRLREAAELLAR